MSLQTLAARLEYNGGDALGRIKKQKLRSLQAALKNDYQSRMIKTPLHAAYPCLINNNDLEPDYDKKILSIEFDSELKAGDVFEVLDDHSHWMVYLPYLTEIAYLRAQIIRCRYTLDVDDETYWVYFQGPTETDLRWNLKNNVNYNELNLSGTIYIKNNEHTRKFFKRFTHIKIDGHMWEVQVTDSISVPGVLELEVQEYYDNTIAELPEIKKYSDSSPIVGDLEIGQDDTMGFTIQPEYYDPKAKWSVSGNDRVRLVGTWEDNRVCKVRIYQGAIKTFVIHYGDYELEVKIEWRKPMIHGPQEVYPYDTHTYWINDDEGTFSVFGKDTKLAKVSQIDTTSCKVDILSSKSGKFELLFEGKNKYRLPITIKSL